MSLRNDLESSAQLAPLAVSIKCEILAQLWDINVDPAQYYEIGLNHDMYFAYYADQCVFALHDGGRHNLIRTHQDIVDISGYIKASRTREEIRDILRAKLSTPKPDNEGEILDNSIDLVARLNCMAEFGSHRYVFTGCQQIFWTRDTVQSATHGYFREFQGPADSGTVRLDRTFNARNMIRIAGLEIEWTRNLADHLRLLDSDKKVAIFHHASYLECQRESALFPKGFVEETLRTIALLFPETDSCTKRWCKQLCGEMDFDGAAIKCGRLDIDDRQIGKFKYWHERLIILKQFFDEAEPSDLSQWWHDRRKGVQWYTFWVAILVLALTIFFGLVQCIEGALQVYKAFYPVS